MLNRGLPVEFYRSGEVVKVSVDSLLWGQLRSILYQVLLELLSPILLF